MSADYQVIWAKAAESDMAEIIEYIMQNSPANAHEVFNKIKLKTENLALLPDRGRVVPELFSQGISLCQSALKSIHLTASNNVQQESKVIPFLAPFYAA